MCARQPAASTERAACWKCTLFDMSHEQPQFEQLLFRSPAGVASIPTTQCRLYSGQGRHNAPCSTSELDVADVPASDAPLNSDPLRADRSLWSALLTFALALRATKASGQTKRHPSSARGSSTRSRHKLVPDDAQDGNGKEAAELYCATFQNARITTDTPMVVQFEIEGKKIMGLNGGPMFKKNPSISLFVTCAVASASE